jgi:hypothetical protein
MYAAAHLSWPAVRLALIQSPDFLAIDDFSNREIMALLRTEVIMAADKKHGNREAKKPKKPVTKTTAAAPSTKDMVSAAVKAAGRK